MRVRFASLLVATAFVTAAITLSGQTASAQSPFDPGPAAATAPANPSPEYTRPVGSLTPTEIIQVKAQAKAAQRQGRIASRAWHGYSQARPTASPLPFSGRYGTQFEGYVLGRPGALYAARPIVVISR